MAGAVWAVVKSVGREFSAPASDAAAPLHHTGVLRYDNPGLFAWRDLIWAATRR
jgi:hypothetical protein